jgi:SAM-dependent methyltransferase
VSARERETPPSPPAAEGFLRYSTTLETHRYPWKDIPGSSHRILLARVEALGEKLRVLDLGFGAGLLARRIRPRCRYLAGIELDPEAAQVGAPFFDRPIVGELLEGLRALSGEPFDVAVAGDILEHLPDPAVALDILHGLLRKDGALLLSLPNVANVSVRVGLLLGRFDYQERGILDRTHLRFFTRRTGRELLEAHGFRVESVTPTAMPLELAFPLLAAAPFAWLVRPLAIALARVWPGLFGYQFVYQAARAA